MSSEHKLEQFGLFAGKQDAIATLKVLIEDYCKLPDPRNLALKLHFNNLWRLGKKYADLIHDAMKAFFNASSQEHAVVEHAVDGLSEGAKLKATEIALLGMILVQNHQVIKFGHYSDDVTCRTTLVANTVKGLIQYHFPEQADLQEKLLPLADLYQDRYDVVRKAEAEKEVKPFAKMGMAAG